MRLNILSQLGRNSTFVPRQPWTGKYTTSRIRYEARRAYSRSRQPQPIRIVKGRRQVNAIFVTIAAVGLGVSGYLLRDELSHWYRAAVRTGRVVSTLYVCIQDYRTTLKQDHDDPEEASAFLKACHKRCAERVLVVSEKNGSIFVKLGQHISSMGYLLPYEWTTTFVPLQDKCPVSSYESIEDMYLRDTGRHLLDDFDEFSKEPLGAASLAQVHTAKLKGSQQGVAVKVQHPSLEEWVPLDIALTRYTFMTLKRVFPEYDLEWLSHEMEFSLPKELDFNLEGENATRARKYFDENTNFPLVIPNVIQASRRILVMDKVSGARIDNLQYLDSHNISRDEVSATLARIFNTMIFANDAPLHCDPHGGNIAVRHNPNRRYPYNFDLVLYDHGLYRVPELKLRRDYAKLWLAVIDADEQRMRKYSYEVAGITDEQFPLFASAITGRDYRVLLRHEATTTARNNAEKEAISEAFGDDLLEQLVALLGRVPSMILLILKTNDLTRSLDESLQTTEGPIRSFLILANVVTFFSVWFLLTKTSFVTLVPWTRHAREKRPEPLVSSQNMESTSKHFNLYDPAGMNYVMDRLVGGAPILQHSEEIKHQVLKGIAEVVTTFDKVKRISIARTDIVAAARNEEERRDAQRWCEQGNKTFDLVDHAMEAQITLFYIVGRYSRVNVPSSNTMDDDRDYMEAIDDLRYELRDALDFNVLVPPYKAIEILREESRKSTGEGAATADEEEEVPAAE
ncbi:hypothetical protein LTS08_001935 [Lithohypha guttulata]|nr:hypothetical protein LTS08_001935 [Lithohypha guttulata]